MIRSDPRLLQNFIPRLCNHVCFAVRPSSFVIKSNALSVSCCYVKSSQFQEHYTQNLLIVVIIILVLKNNVYHSSICRHLIYLHIFITGRPTTTQFWKGEAFGYDFSSSQCLFWLLEDGHSNLDLCERCLTITNFRVVKPSYP